MNDEQKGLMKYLLRGVLFILPLAITLFLVKFGIGLSEEWFGGIARALLRLVLPEQWFTGNLGFIPGFVSLLLLLAFLFVVGRIASWPCGRQGLRLIDVLFQSIPGVRGIYSAIRKMVEALGDSSTSRFQRVVFIDWQAHGTRVLGFVTGETINEADGRKFLVIFVPHMPNPTSGFVLWVAEEDTADAGMTPQEGFKLAMSLGVLTPPKINVVDKKSGNTPKGDGPGGSQS